ncbi:MAG: hypothetical protein H5T63_06010, partial [Chloroflexi bacterium]|nr:hypothetical protein [Chloroflexota bacterium]
MSHTLRRALFHLLVFMLLGICLCLLLLWVGQMPSQSLASGGAEWQDLPGTVRVLPHAALVDVGKMVTVEVWLEDGGNYYGIDVRLSFDP